MVHIFADRTIKEKVKTAYKYVLHANDPVGQCSNPRISFQICQNIIAYAIQ